MIFAKRPRNCTMNFQPGDHRIRFADGDTVLEAALDNELPLDHSCGGMGSCGTCLISVESALAELPPREDLEHELATDRGLGPEERLACQLRAYEGLVARLPGASEG